MQSYQEFLNEAESIDKVQKRIAKLTDINNHTESVIELARWLKDKKAEKMLQGFIDKQTQAGYMPDDLIKKRNNMLNGLLAMAKSKLDADTYKRLHLSF